MPRAAEDLTARREIAQDMAEAAGAWLERLDAEQRSIAVGAVPSHGDTDAERRRWFYTPTDHGGLTMHQQRPAQQRAAMKLVATGLSTEAYVTVATIMGLENVLDHVENSWSCSTASAGATRACTTCGCSASPAARSRGAGASAGTTCH